MSRIFRYLFIAVLVCAVLLSGCSESKPTISSPANTTSQTAAPAQPDTTVAAAVTSLYVQTDEMTIVVDNFIVDIDDDGSDETIAVESVYDEDYIEGFVTLEVYSSSGSYMADIELGKYECAYITRTNDGQACMLICISYIDNETYILSFDGYQPIVKDRVRGLVSDVSGTEITAKDWVDAIGSWNYSRGYNLADDFTLGPVTDYIISTSGKEPLHTIRKLPVEMLVGGAYVQKELDADTLLNPVSTDGSTYLKFSLDSGEQGRILFELKSYGHLINGIDESEYFDNIEYWG